MISVFDLFSIGIGPSSSHTMGPMRAARVFAEEVLNVAKTVKIELYGSLALTGEGHGTGKAILLGLEGHTPEGVDPDKVDEYLERIRREGNLLLLGKKSLPFKMEDLQFCKGKFLPFHSNAMRFTANDSLRHIFYSIGGGFILRHGEEKKGRSEKVPYPFETAEELLSYGLPIGELMMENEKTWRSEVDVNRDLLRIWNVMQGCVVRGVQTEGVLPGGLEVKRRAPTIYKELIRRGQKCYEDPALILDWTSVFALAVNEENAAGGRIVTAPTNGASGIIPAVLHYYRNFIPQFSDEGVVLFLLVAGAIGQLFKSRASLSAAEVGCQGEVGVACSMAAAGLAAVLGGTNAQIEHAAEIGMEHNLGLTCDPVGGLVQIPCIERNTMGAIQAINAARLALLGDGEHKVSLDTVIATMYQTGKDMAMQYKETSEGGLATHYRTNAVSVNLPEC